MATWDDAGDRGADRGRGVSEAEVDGRTARRDRNRSTVLDAVLALFSEGNLQPRPEDVASRSGVSLRSVYRYYSDPAALLQAAMRRHLESVTPLLQIQAIGAGPLLERVDRLVDARLRLYEAIAPAARAARLAARDNEVIRARMGETEELLRGQVSRHFEPELTSLTPRFRRAISDAIDALVQLEALDYLFVERALPAREVAETLRIAIAQLLAAR
jgi:AcrR family transcriptional regulator